jgi:hypothetical protein
MRRLDFRTSKVDAIKGRWPNGWKRAGRTTFLVGDLPRLWSSCSRLCCFCSSNSPTNAERRVYRRHCTDYTFTRWTVSLGGRIHVGDFQLMACPICICSYECTLWAHVSAATRMGPICCSKLEKKPSIFECNVLISTSPCHWPVP